MVRHALSEPVQRMERMARVWSRHDPFVVRLVQSLVGRWVMQTPVNPIYEEVGEGHEERDLQVIVKGERSVGWSVVEFGIAANFADEERGSKDGHQGHGDQALPDFKPNLVFEVFGVGKGGVVEHENIRKRCADEVDNGAKKPEKASAGSRPSRSKKRYTT